MENISADGCQRFSRPWIKIEEKRISRKMSVDFKKEYIYIYIYIYIYPGKIKQNMTKKDLPIIIRSVGTSLCSHRKRFEELECKVKLKLSMQQDCKYC